MKQSHLDAFLTSFEGYRRLRRFSVFVLFGASFRRPFFNSCTKKFIIKINLTGKRIIIIMLRSLTQGNSGTVICDYELGKTVGEGSYGKYVHVFS